MPFHSGQRSGKGHKKRSEFELEDDITPATKRQYTESDQKLAKLYDQLADEVADIRLKAAKNLFEELSPNGQLNPEASDKALRRLIRGLCSSRKAARAGFSITLTELIRQIYSKDDPFISLNNLIELMKNCTRSIGSVPGQERRDYEYGRLYACKALMESSVLNNNHSAWTEVLEMVVNQARSIPWIREECGMILCDAVRGLNAQQSEHIASCLEKLKEKEIIKSPEGVAVWLEIESQFPKFDSYPTDVWKHTNLLHEKNGKELVNAMKEQIDSKPTTNGTHGKFKQGIWKQKLHFSWLKLFLFAIQRCIDSSKEKHAENLKRLWTNLVDDGLFHEKASLERKSWGFQLFNAVLSSAPSNLYEVIFSPNLKTFLVDQCSNAEKTLHKAAKDTLKKMKSVTAHKPEVALPMIRQLKIGEDYVLFDRMTNTKTIAELAVEADVDGYKKLVKELQSTIRTPTEGKEDSSAENIRSAVADILLHSFRERRRRESDDVDAHSLTSVILTLFAKYAYCVPKESEEAETITPEISAASRLIFHSRLYSCLSAILSGRPSNPGYWPYEVVHKIHKITKKNKPFDLALDADKEVNKSLKNAFRVVESIQEDESAETDKPIQEAMTLLICLTLLQAYKGEPDSVLILDDLVSCYSAILDKDTTTSAYELLVEVLLSFISKPSKLFRSMAEEVFAVICPQLSESGLQSLFDILLQSESLAGQQELFEENVSVESDSDEMDSDVEMVNGGEPNEGDDSSDESEEDEGDEIEEDDEELKKFENVLAQALQTSKIVDEDESTSDGEAMDDEEMLAIEPTIAKVFQERRLQTSKRKEKENARDNIVNFKRRVLDLLTIYVKQQHNNPLSVSIILPLIQLLRTTRDKSLDTSTTNLLKLYYSLFPKNSFAKSMPLALDGKGGNNVWTLLEDAHEEVLNAKNASRSHGMACSRASLFAARMLLTKNRDNFQRIAERYLRTNERWFNEKDVTLPTVFFTEWTSFCAEMRKSKN